MDRGIYAASSGGLLNNRRLQIVSNNLANVNTVGFKAERISSRQQQFSDTLANAMKDGDQSAKGDHDRVPGVVDVSTFTDFTPGPIKASGDPLHVALRDPNQFFVVQTENGEALTRAGNFKLDSTGTLVTPDNKPVLGEGGPLSLPQGQAQITDTGTIVVNGENAGRLRVVQVDDLATLKRADGTRFTVDGAAPAAVDADLVAGSLEMPNVGVVESMVAMIAAQRSFEAYTKTVQSIDQLNDTALRVGRTGG